EWQSTKPPWVTTPRYLPGSVRPEIQVQARRGLPQLAQRARLELADALAGDPELLPDLLERPRGLAVQAEPPLDDEAHPRLERAQRLLELDGSHVVGRRGLGPLDVLVLDQVAVETLAVADGRLEADRILHQREELLDPLLLEA